MSIDNVSTTIPRPHPNVIVELITYDRHNFAKYDNMDVSVLLTKLEPDKVNWINIDGLNDQDVIDKVQNHFCLHPLLIEDVVADQRPKSEDFDGNLFFTMKMLHRINGMQIDYEQISFVLGPTYLITFQEKEGDLFDGFRNRIEHDLGKVRKKNADYLLYRLVDIIVDNYYTVLDKIGDIIDEIEEDAYENPSNRSFNQIQRLKKEIIFLRKALYPLREAVGPILKGESEFIAEESIRYYADVYDHIAHLIDSLDTYMDLTAGLMDIHINAMNTKMNEVMKVLTVISTIFMPLTFIVGVYGMNFHFMPELSWKYGYLAVWGVMGVIFFGMLAFFRRKKWF
jgi:magnesium transporter